MKLVIVESPTKAKTIQQFLGKDYKIESSFGHVRDLPKSKLGIDVEHNFAPAYIIPTKARKTVSALKNEVKNANEIILATDEDREGEAISWHLAQVLDLENSKSEARNSKPIQRIVFHEITKQAIEEALKNPRDIDIRLVDAQQARRILDRLVGYKLSPFLWRKVARGLSAGRVQSVAVRLVVEREREIRGFEPEEYWSIEAMLRKFSNDQYEFTATLVAKDEKPIPKLGIKNENEAKQILKELEGATYQIANIEKKETKRNPLAPFTTSTLQQEAWQRLRFSAKQTMATAQQLYETGLITYHRTDSFNLSKLSLSLAKQFIINTLGQNYWPGFSRQFKTKSRGAQEAHEAIRPAYPDKTPETLKNNINPQQYKLYNLIWQRFIASQMSPAIFDSTNVDIAAKNYTFRSSGQTLRFDGFLKVYPMRFTETELPPLEKDEALELQKIIPTQHFTEPPPRYTEATLVKALEKYGIGRPSTYAPTLSTIQERNYVEKDEQKRFRPTDMGEVVSDLLVQHFKNIVDINFTAKMEGELDEIAEGEKEWVPVIRNFYEPFSKNLEQKYKEISKKEIAQEVTDKLCPQCGAPVVIRLGRFGKFYACTKFPGCKYTESLANSGNTSLGISCPKCQKGEIVTKRTKRGKIFYGCNRYPECDFALWDKPINKTCTECGSLLVETKRKQIKCSNPACKNSKAESLQKPEPAV
ncbi:MAG: type I DNA topoisomerase [Candidatus Wildermuthbacteria bacterium]|nr:type I DNA topoisomerase [Candidatus Wildermuthbacteria bacterium]